MKTPEQPQKRPIWQRIPWRLLIFVLVITAVVVMSQPILWPGGLGIGKDQSVTTKSVESVVKDAQGNITKTIETTKNDDGKTLWDWLSLLGVPFSLAVLGYWLQQIQQQRADKMAIEQRERDEKVATEQRERAAEETKEEVLQVYFDSLSVLLVDKNLLAIAAKLPTKRELEGSLGYATAEERELLDSAVDVIRARTLSILRRFENDPERKTSVIRFLLEADIISKLRLNLSDADLSGTDLSWAKLDNTNLSKADLSGADLRGTHFFGADLSGANLTKANISQGILSKANLSHANLTGVNLNNTSLSGAKLNNTNLSEADLSNADLSEASLFQSDLSNANLIEANLTNASLFQPDLSNADLSGANLTNACLIKADLSGAARLTADQLEDAKLCHTILPEGITLDPNRDCKELERPKK